MIQLTPNLTKEEFQCRCGCGFMEINVYLVNRLQVIRDIVNLPMLILSGCRCDKHNKEVGGAINSFHRQGYACDFRFEEYSMLHLAIMLDNWSGGFHFYKVENFIHLDIGPKRRW